MPMPSMSQVRPGASSSIFAYRFAFVLNLQYLELDPHIQGPFGRLEASGDVYVPCFTQQAL